MTIYFTGQLHVHDCTCTCSYTECNSLAKLEAIFTCTTVQHCTLNFCMYMYMCTKLLLHSRALGTLVLIVYWLYYTHAYQPLNLTVYCTNMCECVPVLASISACIQSLVLDHEFEETRTVSQYRRLSTPLQKALKTSSQLLLTVFHQYMPQYSEQHPNSSTPNPKAN